ncbi:hypothetical protein FLAG1_09606, partial [Fusarium langsethiae]
MNNQNPHQNRTMQQMCIICGSCIISGPIEALVWLARIRLVRCRPGDSSATLTGVGHARQDKFTVPSDASSCIIPGNLDPELEQYVRTPKSPLVAFHESCWNMLLDYMSLEKTVQYEKDNIAQCLYDLISDLPHGQNSSVFIGQNVFTRYWQENSFLPSGFEYAVADPNKLLFRRSKNTKPCETETEPLPVGADTDNFTHLPTELIHHLILFMDSPSLCNLRLSSRAIAIATRPNNLPQAFWASRFDADHEVGFFPLKWQPTSGETDWHPFYLNLKNNLQAGQRDLQQLYLILRHSLQDCSETGHMRNRKRIWRCIERLSSPMKMMLHQTTGIQNTSSLLKDITQQGLLVTKKTQGLARTKPLREKGSQFLNLDPERFKANGLRISTSTIRLKSTDYICGLRISTGDGNTTGDEISRVGFVLPTSETHLYIRESARLVAIRVAVSTGGIIGLGIQEEDITGNVLWQSAGPLDNLPDFSGVITLKPRTNSRIFGLILGFDTYKAISLQLVEKPNGFASEQTTFPQPQPWLWHPVEPSSSNLNKLPEITRTVVRGQPTIAFNMNFGGSNGSLLPLLVQVSVLTSSTTQATRGLAFYYIDGSCKRYLFRADNTFSKEGGSVCEQAFPLDGPSGERITVLMLGKWDYDLDLKIITNFGRILTMRRTDVDEGFGGDDQTYNVTTQSIEVPDRQTIVGILASVKNTLGSGTIETLGISCIQNKGTLLPPNLHLKLDENEGVRLVETLPRWRLTTNPFVRNSSTAMVCLERVRRIGISTATVRRSVYISGLCLEFWDLTPPLYIGLWVKEVDWLLLNQGDEIERIKYWRLHGRLLGIRIEKSGSGITAVEVHGSQVSDEVCDERPSIYTANQFERLDELKWIGNSTGSLITIQTRPTDSAQGMLIGDIGSAMANESLFWEIQDSEGKTRAVTHIHAYFHVNGQKLCGFEFCYEGKLSRCVGHTSGVKASAVMGPDERVTCATTNISWNDQGTAKDDGVVV